MSATGFVDDVNIFTHEESTEQNCRNLKRIHLACETWAKHHRSSFDPQKYVLTHFIWTPKRFNMQAVVQLNDTQISPSDSVKVLEVRLDPAL
jgi:hypothetical protein